MNRSRFLALTVAAATATTGALASTAGASAPQASAAAGGSLTGAGSTLVAPLMARWSSDFQRRTGTQVTYGAVGSGAGIADISSRTVDFGASDAPLTAEQRAACHGCVQIPWALTATGIAFHLNGVHSLRLTPGLLAQIYRGQITNWNDKRIRSINKGEHMPNLKITPVYRSDGSGDTYAFTDLLRKVNKGWSKRIGYGTAVSFPQGVGGKGNDGVTALVTSTNGSVAYIAASYIIAHNLPAASLQNRAGRFVYPNLKNIRAAGSAVKHVHANNEMHIVNSPRKLKQAYPLSTFTYAIVPKVSGKRGLLAQFIRYAASKGQVYGPALDFSPIPKVVYKAAKKTIRSLKQG